MPKTDATEPLHIPDEDVAKELRLDFGDLENVLRAGDIPSSRQGRLWYVPKQWMDAYRAGEVDLPDHVKALQIKDAPPSEMDSIGVAKSEPSV